MAGGRFLVAGGLMLGWTILRAGRSFRRPSRREWRDSTIVGALLLGGGMGLVAWGEQTVPSGIAALLIAMMPVWVAVLGWGFLRERLPKLTLAGIAMGLAGVAILVAPAGAPEDRFDPAGTLALLVSPILWTTGSLYAAHRATLPSQPLVATAAQMLTGGSVLLLMGATSGELVRLDLGSVSEASILAVVYLTIIGSLVGFTAYGWLLRVAPLPLIATYAYVNPIVAVALGALILSEPISARTLVAGAVIVVAVAIIISTRSRVAGPAAARVAARTPDPSAVPPVPTPHPSPLPGNER
jgi:drug/metabolite transporter (DMT)-like permease